MSKTTFIIICLGLAIILGIGWVQPKYQELKIVKQEIEQRKTELQNKEEYFESLRKLREELKNYQEQLAKIDLALPTDPSVEILVNFLQKASSQSGLVLKEIGPPITQGVVQKVIVGQEVSGKTEEKESKLNQTELSLTISGEYSSFRNFLSALEESARLIEVKEISFSSPEKELPDFELRIKVHSY